MQVEMRRKASSAVSELMHTQLWDRHLERERKPSKGFQQGLRGETRWCNFTLVCRPRRKCKQLKSF